MKKWYDLFDPSHALIVLIGIIVGAKVAGGALDLNHVGLSAVVSFSIIAAAFILNDYWDFETDKENNRRDKPLVTGEVSKKTALILSVIFLVIGNYSSYLINEKVFTLSLVFTGVLLAYNYYLKKVALVGNIAIGLTMAVPFIYGNLIVSNALSPFVLILSSMAFLMGVGRELIASIRDKKGDEKQGRKTLPMIIGDEKTSLLASVLILTAVLLSAFPFFTQGIFYHDAAYAFFIILTDLLLIISIKDTLKLTNFKRTRKLTLIAQLTGVLGFLIATLI